jgi:hypothetical protein
MTTKLIEINWRNVLDCKRHYGFITKMADVAYYAGYPAFLWNDRVYVFTTPPRFAEYEYKDTGKTIHDLIGPRACIIEVIANDY